MSQHDALRKERIGIVNAARLLKVSVTEIKEALRSDNHLRGHKLPKPTRCVGPSNTQYFFTYGEIMDLVEKMNEG